LRENPFFSFILEGVISPINFHASLLPISNFYLFQINFQFFAEDEIALFSYWVAKKFPLKKLPRI
jgi:hypothetical protein